MVSHWNLSNCKSPQVSRTLLSILADLNNGVVLMVSRRSLIYNPSSSCIKHLVTVPSAPITSGIIATFMFHFFFSSPARSRYLSCFPLSFNCTQVLARTAKSTIWQVFFAVVAVVVYHYVWSSVHD